MRDWDGRGGGAEWWWWEGGGGQTEREGERDADQLITAANKMQIYPGTEREFKHGAVQKLTAARAARQGRPP